MRLRRESPQRHGSRHPDLDRSNISFGDFGDDPDARVVSDAKEFISSHHALAFDDPFHNYVACSGRCPVDGPGIRQRLVDLLDAAVWDIEITQALHGAGDIPA